jgi:aminoglycoside phosphotransferase family enzyme
MKRFPEANVLDKVVTRGDLSLELAKNMWCSLAKYHHDLPALKVTDGYRRNILMTSSGPLPFNALEFDTRMATTDVLYEIAFLLMDMIHHDMPT